MMNKISLVDGSEIVVRSGDFNGTRHTVESDGLGIRVDVHMLVDGGFRHVETALYPWSAVLAFKIAY